MKALQVATESILPKEQKYNLTLKQKCNENACYFIFFSFWFLKGIATALMQTGKY